jgi:hypothetical protein
MFTGMLALYRAPLSISFSGRDERAAAEMVSGTYFPVLGLQPALGRLFSPDDNRTASGGPLAVRGYEYWQSRFGGDTTIIGTQMLFNDHRLTIVGIAPRGFDGMDAMFPTQIYVPMVMAPDLSRDRRLENRRLRWVQVLGCVKPGVTRPQAKAWVAPAFHRILDGSEPRRVAHTWLYTRQQFLRVTLNVLPGGGGNNIPRIFLEVPVLAMEAWSGWSCSSPAPTWRNLIIARSAAWQKEIAVRLTPGRAARAWCVASGSRA